MFPEVNRYICKKKFRFRFFYIVSVMVAGFFSVSLSSSAGAVAKQSTLSVDISTHSVNLNASVGTFGKTEDVVIDVSTDNYTGYTLSFVAVGSTSLISEHNIEIESITSAIDETTFSTGTTYDGMWGYKPSQYITTSNNVNTVNLNTDYLPVPDSTGVILDVTSAANSTENEYTIGFAAKIAQDQAAGAYTYSYNIVAVANTIVYNVTYDEDSNETIRSMPNPRTQVLTIDGGTPTAESYAPLNPSIPTMVNGTLSFGGWCTVPTTYNSTTGSYECSGTTYAAGAGYPIDQTIAANITLYAIWENVPFKYLWTQMPACEFHGATDGNITGTECQDYLNDKFIDTGIALYSNDNYLDDYEVHFTIDHYDPSENDSMADQQQTFVSDKLSETVTSSPYDGKAPGMIVRRVGDNIQIRNTYGHSSSASANYGDYIVPASSTTDIAVYRIDNMVYASINHGPLQDIQNVTNYDQQFGLNTWFGAYVGDDCTGNTTGGVCTNATRFIEATLSNMFVKVGDFDKNIYTVKFDANGGTPSLTNYKVIEGDFLGPLPEPTRTGFVLMYWYKTSGGNSIATPETQVYVDGNIYYAFWLKEASAAQFNRSHITLPEEGTETVVVTNSAELEDFTFSSSDESVATVDSTTGLVTGVGVGTTTIVVTGTKSHTTASMTVTVSDTLSRITFDAGPGSSIDPIVVEDGETIDELPISIRSGYTLEGWYTGENGTGTKLTTSTVIDGNIEYYANWIVTTNVCKIATELHWETCNKGSSTGTNGCRTGNLYAQGERIYYGTIPNETTPKAGFAYTCDINANNEYDEETERFYYLGTNNGNAVLVWYKNISDVSINYNPAYELLPDSNTWRNTNLIAQANDKVTRFMRLAEVTEVCGGNATTGLKTKICNYLMEKSNYANTNLIDGIWLEKVSNSSGRRIHTNGLSLGTVNPADGGSNNAPRPVIEIPMNMLEMWTPAEYIITFNPHNGESTWDETITGGDALGSAYPATDPTYLNHIFQGWYTEESGGTLVTSSTEPSGSTTYHAQWKGTVALATVTNNSISVPVNQIATVAVSNAAELEGFSFSSSDTSVATIDSTTGVITPITQGTTNISITGATSNLSNQIVTVTITQAVIQYTITFDPQNNNATSPWDETIIAEDDLSDVYPATDPTYTDHIFQGWYTAASGGTQISSSTVPDSSTTYYAQWLGMVALAVLDSNSITVEEGNTATITVTNPTEIESYGFASLDSNVATVDSSTGVVTGVAAGTTSIRMTGTTSLTYVDVPVIVTAPASATYTVFFNPHNGENNTSVVVTAGSSIGSSNIPADPVNPDTEMIFMGWYTEASGGNAVDGMTTPSANGEIYHAQYKKIVCKLETSRANLHVHDTNVEYGQIADDPTPHPGDAYNCDVDYDDTYSAVNERFYYLGTDANNNSSLVAWNSYYDDAWAAGTSNDTIFTYTNALAELPDNTTGAWDNPGLIEQETGKAARFTKRDEVATACNKTVSQLGATNALLACDFLMEHSAYDSGGRSALWLMKEDTTQYRIHSGSTNRHVSTSATGSSMVRPTIVVPYKLIEKYSSNSGSDTPVVFDVSNDATRGYQALSSQWVQSPFNIATFNKDTNTINNSTWGDTSELSELQYWNAIRSNFVNNGCFIQTSTANNTNSDAVKPLSGLSDWSSGSVDCSKPDTYNTNVNAPLTVRLNDAQGAVVAYAKADSGIIHNMIPGQTYYWEKTSDSSVYGYVTAVSNGSSTGTRWVDMDVVRNARDIGGLPVTYTDSNNQTVTGTLAYGRIFRGEKLQNVSASELTNLGITTEYNVGDEYSGDTHLTDYHLNQVIHYDFDYNSGDENNANSNYMKAWNAVTNIMTDIVNTNTTKNVYIHCRVGADRTGTVIYLLEGLLGVPDEQRYEEYGLTNLSGLYDRTRYYKQKSSSNNLKFVYMMDYVLTNQNIYNWYMHNPNADVNLIQAFRTAMTVVASSSNGGNSQNSSPSQNSLNSINNSNSTLNNNSSGSTIVNAGNPEYTAPLGVSETHVGADNAGSPAAIGLAIGAAVAVLGGAALFSVAYSRNDKCE